jgi:anti-anti-sigma factor
MPDQPKTPQAEITVHGDHLRIAISGDLDAVSSPVLGRKLDDALSPSWPDAVLDLQHVDFLDSSGLGLLINLSRRMSDSGASLRLCNVPGPVRRIFELTGVGSRFQGALESP